tara:strand:- start:129 stop:353 length:225 start_codon:yes stop_codon:yes gene_type:complete
MEYTERDLDELISLSIKECESLPYLCQFKTTEQGRKLIFQRVKEHIFTRGIANIDTCLALVEQELTEPYIEPNN